LRDLKPIREKLRTFFSWGQLEEKNLRKEFYKNKEGLLKDRALSIPRLIKWYNYF